MPIIREVRGFNPRWGENCFIAENATIVGDVVLGDNCSVWFQAVIRGDVNSIRIGNRVNIQDGSVLHCTFQQSTVSIGDDVTIGHNAVIHGCTIEANALVGMGAIVMDNAIVKEYCLIGAGSVVLENQICESGFIYAGSPARKIKPIPKELKEGMMDRISTNYVIYASWFIKENEKTKARNDISNSGYSTKVSK